MSSVSPPVAIAAPRQRSGPSKKLRFRAPPQDSICVDSQPSCESQPSVPAQQRPAQNYLMMQEHSRSPGLALGLTGRGCGPQTGIRAIGCSQGSSGRFFDWCARLGCQPCTGDTHAQSLLILPSALRVSMPSRFQVGRDRTPDDLGHRCARSLGFSFQGPDQAQWKPERSPVHMSLDACSYTFCCTVSCTLG